MRFFKSYLIPAKAILLDLISIASAFGFVVFATKHFYYHLDQIEAWTLIFSFAVLFGLSMDYEVFIVSRIREAYLKSNNNEAAVIEGIENTAGVVTTAATILMGAMTGFLFGHFAGLQELGVALTVGILIDATLIRLLLLPSAMILLGRLNWKGPA